MFFVSISLHGHRKLPQNTAVGDVSRMFYQASGFFRRIRYNKTELEILQSIIELNRYSIGEAMHFIQQSCDELFVRCRYEDETVQCSELFKPKLSHYGTCCTFNGNHEHK